VPHRQATKTKNSKGETSNADPSNAIREPSAADKVRYNPYIFGTRLCKFSSRALCSDLTSWLIPKDSASILIRLLIVCAVKEGLRSIGLCGDGITSHATQGWQRIEKLLVLGAGGEQGVFGVPQRQRFFDRKCTALSVYTYAFKGCARDQETSSHHRPRPHRTASCITVSQRFPPFTLP